MNQFAVLTRKGQDLLALGALVLSLGLASTLAVIRVGVTQKVVDPASNPSPLGYTFSLALFALPCAIFGVWVARSPRTGEQRRAFGLSLAILIPLGFVLDLFLGRTFLTFPNPRATLGILVPGFDWHAGWRGLSGPGWKPYLPIEEFVFYALGFTAMLLVYVWGDAILFPDSKIDDRQRTPRVFKGWTTTLPFWLGIGTVLFGVSWAIRRHVASESGHAFPGYFLFLLIGSILPSLVCSRVAFQFMNWRALTLGWLFVLAISQSWEAGLGIPYGWWGYQPDQMMGLFIKPACNLPVEAVLVWTLGSWTTAIVYETILTALHAGRSGWKLFSVFRVAEHEIQSIKRHSARRKK